jgi:hypothetical protein
MHRARLVAPRVSRSAWRILAAVCLTASTADHVQGDDEADIYADASELSVPIASPSNDGPILTSTYTLGTWFT